MIMLDRPLPPSIDTWVKRVGSVSVPISVVAAFCSQHTRHAHSLRTARSRERAAPSTTTAATTVDSSTTVNITPTHASKPPSYPDRPRVIHVGLHVRLDLNAPGSDAAGVLPMSALPPERRV